MRLIMTFNNRDERKSLQRSIIFSHKEKRGIIFGFSRLGKNTPANYPQDCHPELELTFFENASGIYTINDREYEFGCNDLFLMPSNTPHKVSRVDRPGYIYNIFFEPRFLWDNVNYFGMDNYLQIFKSDLPQFQYRLDRANPAREQIMDLIRKIHSEFIDEKCCFEHMARIYIEHILVIIYRNFGYCKADEGCYVEQRNIKLMSKSIDYIDEHYCENLRLENLASIANMSPTYYGIIFKRLNGITPWEYITAKRIDCAIEKLKNEECTSMHELAYSCGFNNTANFNRAFKKYTGTVPSKYFKSK